MAKLTQAIERLQSLSNIDGKSLSYDEWKEIQSKAKEALEVLHQFKFEATLLLSSIENDTYWN